MVKKQNVNFTSLDNVKVKLQMSETGKQHGGKSLGERQACFSFSFFFTCSKICLLRNNTELQFWIYSLMGNHTQVKRPKEKNLLL